MAGGGLRKGIGIGEDEIKNLATAAWKAHESAEKHYLVEKNSQQVIISFPGVGVIKEWFSGTRKPFGETEIDLKLFPSLKSVGNNKTALVNEAFLKRFQDILSKSKLRTEVEKAMKKKKQIFFTGHSSGAAVAILATLWTLETSPIDHKPPLCVTFGSPLVGNHIFSHAIRRENWSSYFIHFVKRYDIVPRILLAPPSSFEHSFEKIYQFLNPKSKPFLVESIDSEIASDFYFAVMPNVAAVSSYAACKLMGNKNVSLETLENFTTLSPYRPFGTYVFCNRNKNFIITRNPDAALQILLFSAQLSTEADTAAIAYKSLEDHLIHDFLKNIQVQNLVCLDKLEEIPLAADTASNGDIATVNMTLNDLGLCTRARLCLLAARESEKRKLRNQEKINQSKAKIEEKLKEVEDYRAMCEMGGEGYYESFKLQMKDEDFEANVNRLDLEALWNEITDMLYLYELPDEFESSRDWIKLGTQFRCLLEPLDIANYYRHPRPGTYMKEGRPRRYKYAQQWLEHSLRKKKSPQVTRIESSCYWAMVEELIRDKDKSVEEKILQVDTWIDNEDLPKEKDVFLKKSTFVKWWETLPQQHRESSSVQTLINKG
ncbi:hypothetical protein L6164_011103 [Bauhinia variegata]|uniref:Uncharacterized protein n=1 Tax=Bauhinia variegata TaxID=167791 RepID=A0ACB9P7F2_BAUVA|nr:hypothetical protein L6164_011103 [Bauhinia variegata]